jgi:hypothetical protein
VRRDYHGDYFQDAESGGYVPAGYDDAILDHFSLAAPGRRITAPAAG